MNDPDGHIIALMTTKCTSKNAVVSRYCLVMSPKWQNELLEVVLLPIHVCHIDQFNYEGEALKGQYVIVGQVCITEENLDKKD
jgi:hypothetical protein